MAIKQILDKEKTFYISSLAYNSQLVIGVIFFVFYAVAPLLGGRFYIKTVIAFASLIILSLMGKNFVNLMEKEQKIKKVQYFFKEFFLILFILSFFKYPFNVFFSILGVVIVFFIYRAMKKKNRIAS